MSEVTDYTALLAYMSSDSFRWNSLSDLGTRTVVTYSFTSASELAPVSSDPYGAYRYWAFDSQQREYFRRALDEFEEASGVIFVETSGPAMINVFGYDGGSAAGWADYPWASSYSTNEGRLAIEGGNIMPGSFGYETVLHEIGHALGLKHPHDGDTTLADHLDTQANTVMTYTYAGYNVTELGTFDVQALQHIYGSSAGTAEWSVRVKSGGMVVIDTSAAAETVLAVGQSSKVYGRGGSDTLIGREAGDKLIGGAGLDTLIGGYGEDRLFGGKGADVLIGGPDDDEYSGSTGEADKLVGGGGWDTLSGGAGDDTLVGGNGRDRLIGGDGSDQLTGGRHADTFVFVSADYYEQEVITDFGVGGDKIEFSGTSVDSFSDLLISQSGGSTFISYYGQYEIELTGFTGTLTQDDFLFT